MTNPMGCRWCGIDQREHARRWKPPVGWRAWEQPTQQQIKDRMQARRAERSGTAASCGWNPADATTDCDWDPNCPAHGRNTTTS